MSNNNLGIDIFCSQIFSINIKHMKSSTLTSYVFRTSSVFILIAFLPFPKTWIFQQVLFPAATKKSINESIIEKDGTSIEKINLENKNGINHN